MSDVAISPPTPESPLLVGLLVDVSGSMTTAMDNHRGQSLNRLHAFEQSLGGLARKAKSISAGGGGAGSVRLFAYGFGFGNPLAAIFGRSGAAVRDLLSGTHRSNSLISIEQLADEWQQYKDNVASLAVEMFGATPMVEVFDVAAARLRAEEQRRSFSGKMLFVLSDGEPTDGNGQDVARRAASLKSDGTLVISCYVTDQDITQLRELYAAAQPDWPDGAALMFECSSFLPNDPAFHAYLSEHHWAFDANSRLFSQINQSEVLDEFLSLVLSPLDSPPPSGRGTVQLHSGAAVFVSYSHKDREWLDRLRVHLKPLEREGVLDLWDESRIAVGGEWRREISEAINSARVAILLVSADFLASDFIANNELPPLLDAARTRGATVIPVLVRPSRFEYMEELACYQSLNPPSAPLSSMPEHEQESTLVQLSARIQKMLG